MPLSYRFVGGPAGFATVNPSRGSSPLIGAVVFARNSPSTQPAA